MHYITTEQLAGAFREAESWIQENAGADTHAARLAIFGSDRGSIMERRAVVGLRQAAGAGISIRPASLINRRRPRFVIGEGGEPIELAELAALSGLEVGGPALAQAAERAEAWESMTPGRVRLTLACPLCGQTFEQEAAWPLDPVSASSLEIFDQHVQEHEEEGDNLRPYPSASEQAAERPGLELAIPSGPGRIGASEEPRQEAGLRAALEEALEEARQDAEAAAPALRITRVDRSSGDERAAFRLYVINRPGGGADHYYAASPEAALGIAESAGAFPGSLMIGLQEREPEGWFEWHNEEGEDFEEAFAERLGAALERATRPERESSCARCGEELAGDRAEVADGIIHAECRRQGEPIA